MKALKAYPAFLGEIDRNALALMMRYGYIPSPHSIYQGIHKLPPGTILSVSLMGDKGTQYRQPTVCSWWMFLILCSA